MKAILQLGGIKSDLKEHLNQRLHGIKTWKILRVNRVTGSLIVKLVFVNGVRQLRAFEVR